MNRLMSLAICGALALPGAAGAARVVYEAEGVLVLSDGFADFFDLGVDNVDISFAGDFDDSGAPVDVEFDVLSLDPFEILLGSAVLLESTIEIVDGPDSAELVFGDLDGVATGLFGPTATALFTFDAAEAVDGVLDANVRVLSDLVPIPLPAALPLLLVGLGIAGVIGRRRGRPAGARLRRPARRRR